MKFDSLIPHFTVDLSLSEKHSKMSIKNANIDRFNLFDLSDSYQVQAMVVLAVLLKNAEAPYCYITNRQICDFTGNSYITVARALVFLQEAGYIHKHQQSTYEIKPNLFDGKVIDLMLYYYCMDKLNIPEKYEKRIKSALKFHVFSSSMVSLDRRILFGKKVSLVSPAKDDFSDRDIDQ